MNMDHLLKKPCKWGYFEMAKSSFKMLSVFQWGSGMTLPTGKGGINGTEQNYDP